MGYVIGVDEVGRGALAGDVYTIGVLVLSDTAPVKGVKDSKVMTAKQREEVSKALLGSYAVRWTRSSRTAKDIDRLGVGVATAECFVECIEAPLAQVDKIIVDGVPIWPVNRWSVPTEFMPKADANVWAVGAASIIAKVMRDSYMKELAAKHPQYAWEKNKGYGTAAHIQALRDFGLSPVHRTKFAMTALGLRGEKEPMQWGPDLPEDLNDLFDLR